MDIDLARTFLEITRRGSFMAAAEQLHVTQTTVTARIHNLEDQLGCRLFQRSRSGAQLTDHGRHFTTHASRMVQIWEAARRELPLPDGTDESVTLGGEMSLWNPLLAGWLGQLTADQPGLAVRIEVGERRTLLAKLQHAVIDAALVHQPEYMPGLQVEQLLEEKLILVRSPGGDRPYVYVDWGASFRQQHDAALPEHARSGISLNLGALALNFILARGGSGYFRTRVVQRHLQEGRLQRVEQAPEFPYPIYLLYTRDRNRNPLRAALAALHTLIDTGNVWEPPPQARIMPNDP